LNLTGTSQIKALLYNIRGIKNNLTELLHTVQTHSVDIAIVTETHLNPRVNLYTPGYKLVRKDRLTKKGGGVAFLIKESIPYREMTIDSNSDTEIIGVQLKVNRRDLTIYNVYNPPNVCLENVFLRKLFSSRGTVIAAGDFNARHRLWGCQKKNKSGGVLYDFVMDRRAALVAPSNPTCVPCNGGTPSTLDLVLTNSHKCITDMRTVTEGGSDHLPVLFNIWGRAEANVKRPIYNFAQTDWDLFRRSLDLNIPTASPPLDTPSRIEAAVESLTREINEAIRISTPTKSQLPPRVELPREIVELIKLKNAVRRRWQSQRREEYKKMMNQLQRAVRDKIAEWKTERWNKMLQNTTTRDNTFWNLLRRFNRQCGRTNPTLRDGSEVASTNPEKATLLAKYFSGVNNQSTTRGNRSFVEQVDAQVRRILTAPPEKHTTPVEIREVLTKLKTNKAPGSDGITNKVAKNISRKALTKLTNIINAILRTCHYPRQWKTATVVALPKPGKLPSLPSSYRPISLLSVLAKITDKIILSRLLRVTEALDIIPDSQFGFRRKHATTHQLSRVVSHVSEHMKSGRSTAMVSLDCEKAYDTVWTNGLLFRLTEYNFPLPLIKIMQSYLSDRNIRVRIGDSLSEEVSLQAGLPQGSVLSPWLFNIYTAHVLRSTTPGVCIAGFADDTALYTSSTSTSRAINRLTNATHHIIHTLNQYKINVNTNKTEAILFTNSKSQPEHIKIRDKIIPFSPQIKYLGLTIDKKLTWKEHLKTVNKKALTKAGRLLKQLLNRNSKLSIENKLTIYKTILKPTWTYGIELWGSAKKGNIDRIQSFKSNVLRTILNAPWYVSNRTIHHDLNIPTVHETIQSRFKSFHSKLANALSLTTHPLNPPRRLKRRWPRDLLAE
ncbi:hypothetical protein AAG570_001731, partial [Ranatra chinensis]